MTLNVKVLYVNYLVIPVICMILCIIDSFLKKEKKINAFLKLSEY